MNEIGFPCVVCGKRLLETRGDVISCSYCGHDEKSDFVCKDRHFVCETCRTCTPTEIILKTSVATPTDDSLFLANLLMHHPAIPMSGPEHHLLVPAILLTATHNAGHRMALESRLRQALKRANRFGLGSCANLGACGAAMGVPIAISLLIGAEYTKPEERKTVLRASAVAMTAVANLPALRCCKASVYSSLSVGTDFIRRELELGVPPVPHPTCHFEGNSLECVRQECPYFEQSKLDGDLT
ncbi:MAG: hypothetical protein JSW61_08220 [Candidatus Thorarchaeota archaeon]|nr:MAG: hypothetical protein JSW61_08220 [Candidatus Thorarchaeota archaeon]